MEQQAFEVGADGTACFVRRQNHLGSGCAAHPTDHFTVPEWSTRRDRVRTQLEVTIRANGHCSDVLICVMMSG
jgi:hypothetical protein